MTTLYPKDVKPGQIWKSGGFKFRIDRVTDDLIWFTWIEVEELYETLLNKQFDDDQIRMEDPKIINESHIVQRILDKYL